MRNIFLFIGRYFVFICFIILQVICIVLLSDSSKTHQTFFASAANEVTGKVDERYNNLREYFFLKQTNKELNAENARLRNQLAADYHLSDSGRLTVIDSLTRDEAHRVRKFTYLPAKVVGNTISLRYNYLMLERGSKQGVKKGMSVVSPQGIVGVVVEVADNYSKVMSLLNLNSKVSALIKKNNSSGDVRWDAADAHFLIMEKVSKSAQVNKGDTVLTSTYSANFPASVPIGVVSEVKLDPASSYYILKITPAVDFFSLQYVYVVENSRFAEQTELANRPQKEQ
jgi:rod shape-determining protein MreC